MRTFYKNSLLQTVLEYANFELAKFKYAKLRQHEPCCPNRIELNWLFWCSVSVKIAVVHNFDLAV